MILKRILLLNFKKYARESIELGTGIIGIFGANGAGKSTIFDAICWCLYGVTPTMGREGATVRQEDLVRDGEEDMGVELSFEHGGQMYTISRSYSTARGVTARVRTEGEEVARSSKDVSQFVTTLLGLDAKAFIAASFIRQKEIDLLTSQRPAKRKDVINRLFGLQLYDQFLSDAKSLQQDAFQEEISLSSRLSALNEEHGSLLESLSYYDGISSQLDEAKEIAKRLEGELARADSAAAIAAKKHEDYVGVERRMGRASERLGMLDRSLRESRESVAAIGDAESRLNACAARCKTLSEAASAIGGLEEQKRAWESSSLRLENAREAFARAVKRNKAALQKARDNYRSAQKEHDTAIAAIASAEMGEAKAAQAVSVASVPDGLLDAELAREKKIVGRIASERARLGSMVERKKELREEQASLSQIGDSAECPLCHQNLTKGHLEKVEQSLSNSLDSLESSISSHRSKIARLENLLDEQRKALGSIKAKLDAMAGAKGQHDRAKSSLDVACQRAEGTGQALRRAASAVEESGHAAVAEEAELSAAVQQLSDDVAQSPFDMVAYESARKAGADLSDERSHLSRLQSEQQRADELKDVIAHLEVEREEMQGIVESLASQMESMHIQKSDVEQAQAESREVLESLSAARETVSALEEKQRSAHSLGRRLDANKVQIAETRGTLDEVQSTIYDYEVLKAAFKDIPINVHERLKPAIQDEVSSLLDTLTHGKYSSVRISDDYTVEVLYNGEFYPIYRFSGGEKDLINLCLRIGISHVLVSLSKTQGVVSMDSLFLDETFSSLDSERRQMLMAALMSLKSFFSQIVIITHVEDIKEAMPRSYEVSENDYGVASVSPL